MQIVYFGNDWFGENRTSSHHIARRLSQRFPLLYVEVPGLRAPKADARDFRKLFRKLGNCFQRPRQIGSQMWHLTVPQVPFRTVPLVGAANRYVGTQLVRSAMNEIGFRQSMLWFTVPHPAHLLGRLGEEFSVYYCIDNYSALPGVDRTQVASFDRHLTVHADLVFVSSPALFSSKKEVNARTVFSPHGVDTELFASAQSPLPLPEQISGLKSPVIGMHGLIDDRIDLELIASIARARPDWTFLLVGRITTDVTKLSGLRNIVFGGLVPYEKLPEWARAYDVAIMPYRQGPFAENANPLKLREYLACGKPVVSIPMPSVDAFRQHVLTAVTAEDFVACIGHALEADSPEARSLRIRAIEHMSWDARVAEVISTVEEHRAEKAGKHKALQAVA